MVDLLTTIALCANLSVSNSNLECFQAKLEYKKQINNLVISNKERDALARVLYAEASTQTDKGNLAVLFVILNRVISGNFSNTIIKVINKKNQFEPVKKSNGWENLKKPDLLYTQKINTMINLILSGDIKDPTKGSLYFQNPEIVKNREDNNLVSKGLTNFGNQKPIIKINNHSFFHSNKQKTYKKRRQDKKIKHDVFGNNKNIYVYD